MPFVSKVNNNRRIQKKKKNIRKSQPYNETDVPRCTTVATAVRCNKVIPLKCSI